MNIRERIEILLKLGNSLKSFLEGNENAIPGLSSAISEASATNPWFTHDHIRLALGSIARQLDETAMQIWLGKYPDIFEIKRGSQRVGIVMAGNIPLVGFHDFLCVFVSGHDALIRLSSDDRYLLPALVDGMTINAPRVTDHITFTRGQLKEFEAVIATGSNNTSRYFEHYFKPYPHIIRKNRNSIAILDGTEGEEVLRGLADDMMLYFGLGCRSVSKLYIPENYNFDPLLSALGKYSHYALHNKYFNNYQYQRILMAMNGQAALNNGFLLFRENLSMLSPVSVIHYETYSSMLDLKEKISMYMPDIQCIVMNGKLFPSIVRPGQAQFPDPWDYSDHVDTMQFLLQLA